MCDPSVSAFRARRDRLASLRPPRFVLSEPGHARPVLRCGGELDGAVADQLEAMVDAACQGEIEALLLDFAAVEFVDARILALLEATRLRLEGRGAVVRVLASGQPLRLLRMTGLAPRLGAWPGPSSSSSSPTTTSVPTGMASIR